MKKAHFVLIFIIIFSSCTKFIIANPIPVDYKNEILVNVRHFNDANYKSNIEYQFNLSVINGTLNSISCTHENIWSNKDDTITRDYKKFVIHLYKIKQFNSTHIYMYNSTVFIPTIYFGSNNIYPYDRYLFNATFSFNEEIKFSKEINPFKLYVWEGEWKQSQVKWYVNNELNSTTLRLTYILDRASSDKTYFQWFYPMFFVFLGFISIINVNNHSGKLGIYLTFFLALSSSLIYFFPLIPPKSGFNCVIFLVMALTASLIFLFGQDIFIYKHKMKIFERKYIINVIIAVSILYLSYTYYYLTFRHFFWFDWFFFWWNMNTIALSFILAPLLDFIITHATAINMFFRSIRHKVKAFLHKITKIIFDLTLWRFLNRMSESYGNLTK